MPTSIACLHHCRRPPSSSTPIETASRLSTTTRWSAATRWRSSVSRTTPSLGWIRLPSRDTRPSVSSVSAETGCPVYRRRCFPAAGCCRCLTYTATGWSELLPTTCSTMSTPWSRSTSAIIASRRLGSDQDSGTSLSWPTSTYPVRGLNFLRISKQRRMRDFCAAD